MTSIDDKIKQALNEEFNDIVDNNEKLNSSFYKQFMAGFKGKNKRIYKVSYFIVILMYIACAFCVYKFALYPTDEIKPLLRWAITSLFFGMAALIGESWFYNELGRDKVMREIKIVELQLAQLLKNQEKE